MLSSNHFTHLLCRYLITNGTVRMRNCIFHLQCGLKLGLALGQHVPLSLHDAHGWDDDYKDENVRMILMLFASLLNHF